MKKTVRFSSLSLFLSFVIVAAMMLTLGACAPAVSPDDPGSSPSATTTTEKPAPTVLGLGNSACTVEVIDAEGHTAVFEVHTDEEYLGDALLNLGLIEGTKDGNRPFYVKKVNGIVADYDVDKTFWAFYVNFELSPIGVEKTPVTDGAVYQFKVEK